MHHRLVSLIAGLSVIGVAPAGTSPDPLFRDSFEIPPPVVQNIESGTLSGSALFASSRLRVTWPLGQFSSVDHFEVRATPEPSGIAVVAGVTATTDSAVMERLEADRDYRVDVIACANPECSQFQSYPPSFGRTAREYWRLMGAGHSVAGLHTLTSDTNARLSATRFGQDGDELNAGHVQLYYGPKRVAGVGSSLVVGPSTAPVVGTDPASWASFVSLAGSSGLQSPASISGFAPVKDVFTGHGVPMYAPIQHVRLYFEAQGSDNKVRIFSVDSKDGWIGRDFHSGSPTVCSTQAEYQPGGACAARIEIGLSTDSVRPNPNIFAARQHKVTFNDQDYFAWDGQSLGFMTLTVDTSPACSTASRVHAYAIPVGGSWAIQYQANGCPKLWENTQACSPVSLGGDHFKVYCGVPSVTAGQLPGSTLPFLGPKRLSYGYGRRTGSEVVIDFEDWDDPQSGHDVVFLWPDDTQLDDRAEGYIDDFQFMLPDADPAFQMAYITITDGITVPTGAAAYLVNY